MSETEKLMAAAAEVLRIEVEPEFEPGMLANLDVAVKMAKLVEAFELDDEAEPAPVFRP